LTRILIQKTFDDLIRDIFDELILKTFIEPVIGPFTESVAEQMMQRLTASLGKSPANVMNGHSPDFLTILGSA
jgi:hypothetical protein